MGGYAWVTLATNDSYSLGALVLAHSLKQVRTEQQLAVLITPGVTEPMRTKLREVFNVVREVNVLDSRDEANLRLLKRPELGITFTKLHCWRLTQYDKCVFLDADTLVLENCDELFEREELSAAPDIGWPDCFNSGVFVYRPSDETYEKLIQFALDKGSFDGGDQGLLNQFFSDWAHKDISKHLPFIYNMASTACYSYLPAFKQFGANAKIIHFIGATKPWLQYFDTETSSVRPTDEVRHLQEILQRWWNIFCSLIHPGLTPDMAGIAGAFARLTLGVKRTPEQEALEDHLRRQGWEIGNIDYLGRDSFENIWSKICETITSDGSPAPPPQPSVPAPTFEQPKEPSPPKTAVELTKETAPVEPEKIVQPEQETPIIESPITKLSESKPQDDIRKTTEIPKEVSEPVSTILKSVQPTEFLESEPLKTILDPCISGKPASLTSPAQTPATLSQLPASPSPTPISTAISAIVSTLEAKSTSPSPVPDSTSTAPDPATLSPVPKTPSPEPTTPTPVFTSPEYMLWSPVSVSPVAVPTCQSSSPASPSPVPASPSPVAVSPSPAPASPSPAPTSPSPAPASPSPAPPSPSPAPASPSPAPPSPSPASTNSEPVPSPVLDLAVSTTTPTNLSDISVSSLSTVTTTPTAAVPEITTPSPVSPAPLPQKPSSIIITASPISKPTYPSPIPTAPISEAPTATRESPISVCPAPILRKQASAPEKQTTVTPDVQSLASAPEIPSLASAQAQPHSVSKQPPKEDACIILAKSGSEVSECSVPSKKSAKKSKESVTIPKAEVTEATPPATPVFQPPKIGKQTLGAKQSVPDTPPPTESSTGPTPPPRKSSGGTKKATGKGKK